MQLVSPMRSACFTEGIGQFFPLLLEDGVPSSIIHFTSHPAYYQNYLLADMIAAQLMHHLESRQGAVLDNPQTGEFFREKVFARGTAVPWMQLLSDTTGESLNVRYYVEQKLGAVSRSRAERSW